MTWCDPKEHLTSDGGQPSARTSVREWGGLGGRWSGRCMLCVDCVGAFGHAREAMAEAATHFPMVRLILDNKVND